MFERLLNILCSYSEEILEHAKKGSFNTQYIMQQETIGDKINYWCRRVINLQSQKWNGLNNLQLYRVLGLIEELMDQYRVFYKELSQDEALTKSKILVKSLETTNKVIIQTANLIRKKDRCLQDLKKYKSTYDKILYSKEFKKTDYKNKYLLSFLVAIIREAIHIVCEELNYSE